MCTKSCQSKLMFKSIPELNLNNHGLPWGSEEKEAGAQEKTLQPQLQCDLTAYLQRKSCNSESEMLLNTLLTFGEEEGFEHPLIYRVLTCQLDLFCKTALTIFMKVSHKTLVSVAETSPTNGNVCNLYPQCCAGEKEFLGVAVRWIWVPILSFHIRTTVWTCLPICEN